MKLYGSALSEEKNLQVERLFIADSFWTRFWGLMGKPVLRPSEGLLLTNTGSIHTCFMRFPIDVVYLNEKYETLHRETVFPWRIGSIVKHTKHVLELSAGKAAALEIGERLWVIPDIVERKTEKERYDGTEQA